MYYIYNTCYLVYVKQLNPFINSIKSIFYGTCLKNKLYNIVNL